MRYLHPEPHAWTVWGGLEIGSALWRRWDWMDWAWDSGRLRTVKDVPEVEMERDTRWEKRVNGERRSLTTSMLVYLM